jgi:photosystem II stability/assembly factor-like uncharacterized protein
MRSKCTPSEPMKHSFFIILFLSLCSICLGAQRPGDFRILGPGGGGAMFHPSISPHDANTVLIACDMTGAYITHDGGKSWRMFNLRGVVDFFTFDPKDPNTIYAHATGLWRSTDAGDHWSLVYPQPAAVKDVKMSSDHSDETIVANPDPIGTISSLEVDPDNSNLLYLIGGHEKHRSVLFISNNRGKTWHKRSEISGRPRNIWIDPHTKPGKRTLFLATTNALFVTTEGSTKELRLPATASDISLGFDSRPTIYITSEQGIFVSTDGGTNWHKSELPGNGAKVRAIATSLRDPKVAYVSYDHLQLDGKAWIGVAKTTNSGGDWKLVWKESDVGAANVHDAWITERFGPGWGENPLNLTVANQDANIAYGTDLGRTMRTDDGGETWVAQYSRKVDRSGWATSGLDVTTSYGIHFDPFDPARQFVTYTDIGLFRSEDHGKSWVSSTMGVPEPWLNTTYWIIFDPKVKGRMWSVNSGTHDLPRPKMWRRNSVLNYRGGVCVSDDGGRTWKKSNDGMAETAPTHIILDPTSPEHARVLYVAAFGRGVYKSTDGGATWALKNQGITQSEPFAWRLARASDGTLYLLIARRSEDGTIGNAGDGALYQSTDGAEHWKPVALPPGVNAPNGLAIDPKAPNRIYLAAWARATGTHGEGGGIFLSENAGKTWKPVLDRDQHVYDVVIDPSAPSRLYAAGFESSAWKSMDRGLHWTRIPGFNFKWGQRVVPDPFDHEKVYITTFGGSVWHGSVNGERRPVDIVTPVMEPGR